MRTRDVVKIQSPEALAIKLGLGSQDAQEWRVQHRLLESLRQIMAADAGLTHAEVARRSGTSRTLVTSILTGNLDNVSSDLLIRLLGALGYGVDVTVSRLDSAA